MKLHHTLIILSVIALQLHAAVQVRIVEIKGQAHIRRNLEETWEPARQGLLLEEMDTILSGEASQVVLKLEDGVLFTMGGNAMLDIHDLRKITDRQLFLDLMTRKVKRIQTKGSTAPIQIANVSVVRGDNKAIEENMNIQMKKDVWIPEKNGALSLYQAKYYTNTVAKLLNILETYPECEDGGEMHCILGQSFEALDQPGRAVESYHTALERYQQSSPESRDQTRLAAIQAGLQRLKSE